MSRDPHLTRRRVLQAGAAVAAGSLLPACGGPTAPGRRRPNVLFVLSDSHRARSLGCYGNDAVRTPAFDAFARQGMTLDSVVSSTPICRPYRASLMSGRYCQHTGQLANASAHNRQVDDGNQWLPADMPLLGRTFTDAGYRCGYFGKWHLGAVRLDPGPLRFGFDAGWTTSVFPTHDYYEWTYARARHDLIEGGGFFRATFETDLALDFLDGQDGEEPWFCFLSWGAPHDPFDPPEEFRHFDKVPLPENVPAGPARKYARKNLPLYYGMIEAVDREFARVLEAVEARGWAEDTIVVYTSDHGVMVGSHALSGKEVPWSEATHVPFLVRWPGRVPAGSRDASLVGTPDLFPSLCGLTGVPVPDGLDGADRSGILLGRPDAPRADAAYLAAHVTEVVPFPGWRGMRTPEHLYVRQKAGPWMLFDLQADPEELTNLVDSRPGLVRDLDERFTALMTEVGGTWAEV